MIDCHEALTRLWEFLDGELEAADEAEVKRHLEVCARCYPRYDFQKTYFELVRRVRDRDAPSRQARLRLIGSIVGEDGAAWSDEQIDDA